MARWAPDSAARLQEAALELYTSQGYERTTVAEIAERAGLTERTFFRYFADKREVLFVGSQELARVMVSSVERAPRMVAPLEAVVAGVSAAAETFFADRFTRARQRQVVIDANTSLQERELIKMATLGSALTGALRARGVPEPAARVAAESGILVFRVAFERWISSDGTAPLDDVVTEVAADLRAVTGA